VDATGVYNWNNLVPGLTPSCPIQVGTGSGTIDAAQVIASSIAASMAVVDGLFGVAAEGITNSLLGNGAVATINVQNLAITNPLLASLCVEAAQLATGAVTATKIAAAAVGTAAIQTAAITNALIANAAISGAQIQSATITGANIASATIADANIGACNVSKLTAGTATFTGDVILSRGSNLPELVLGSGGLTLWSNGSTTTSAPYAQITATGMELSYDSTHYLQVFSSGLTVVAGNSSVQVSGTAVTLTTSGSYDAVAINSTGEATFTNSSATSTVINGSQIDTGSIFAASIQLSPGSITFDAGLSVGSASAGSATLPANPVGFVEVVIGSTTRKIPYYA